MYQDLNYKIMILILRNIGSKLLYFFYRYFIKKKFHSKYLNPKIIEISLPNKNISFFGYYNISPFNNKKILYYSINRDKDSNAYESDTIYICYYDLIEKKSYVIGSSNAWNWQQGSMLQWYGNSDDLIIFNDYDKEQDKYLAKIVNIRTNEERKIILPIYSVSHVGDFALTLNFDRLAWLRPDYGYFTRKKRELLDLKNDGIWKIDLVSNKKKLVISLQELKDFNYVESMNTDLHKVNHIDISPDSKHFMFLHRWYKDGIKHTRLIVADSNGANLKILCGDKMVSHCTWKNNDEIVCFAYCKEYGNKYYKFNIHNNNTELFFQDYLSEDGHPSFDNSERYFLTDTYPKRERFSKLILIDTIKNQQYLLGEFFQPLKYKGSFRIDLHPRFSKDGRFISFDSGHTGKRQQHILDISKIVNAK